MHIFKPAAMILHKTIKTEKKKFFFLQQHDMKDILLKGIASCNSPFSMISKPNFPVFQAVFFSNIQIVPTGLDLFHNNMNFFGF